MTRKDYMLIAAAIKEQVDAYRIVQSGHGISAISDVAFAIARALAADNPRFDRERFIKACGF